MSKQDSKNFTKEITPRSQDFSQWYIDVVRKAGLADYTMMKGCMVIKPYGYALWENLKAALDQRIKDTGHENAYFPLFVPESLLNKEKEHVEGFAPEVAWVTQGGNEPLEERLAVRPTSEAIIGPIYADWIQSYRDLPLLINQWANVVRWEKVTRLFLRTTEFLWQEGHTCHRTEQDAEDETLMILRMYQEFAETEMAMPVHVGRKTDSERFPGAERTYCIEAMMGDGKALQAGTSHMLGQHFSKMYDIMFEDEDQQRKHVWTTSWGVSTRLIGGLIMTHGDDNGLILPPRVAPIQVVIVPIFKGDNREAVCAEAAKLRDRLKAAGVRVKLDDRDTHSPGWKYNEYEMKGVPLRLELGPKDIEKQHCVLVRRDNREKTFVPLTELEATVPAMLVKFQADLLERAKSFREENTRRAESYEQFKSIIENERGFVWATWNGSGDVEAKVKEETKATVRCIPMDDENRLREAPAGATCIFTGEPAKYDVLFARSY